MRSCTKGQVKFFSFDTEKGKVLSDLEEPGMWNEDGGAHQFLLMFIHARDKQWMDAVEAKKQIWYGGNAGFDSDVPTGGDKIDRGITNDGFLEEFEIRQLVLYAKGLGERPDFLLKNDHDKYLKCEQAPKLIQDLSVPDKGLILNMPLPSSLPECRHVFEDFKAKALNLIERTPNISPFNDKYLKLLTELKLAIFKIIGDS